MWLKAVTGNIYNVDNAAGIVITELGDEKFEVVLLLADGQKKVNLSGFLTADAARKKLDMIYAAIEAGTTCLSMKD